MPFSKNVSVNSHRNKQRHRLYKTLDNLNAKWYMGSFCGYCKIQKKVLSDINPQLLNLIKEDTKDVPESIKGFPTLFIPKSDENTEDHVISGLRNEDQLLQIVSKYT